VSRPGRTSWLDLLVAGLLALLTGREVLREFRQHAALGHARNGQASASARPIAAGRARLLADRPPLPPGVHLPRPSVWPMVLGGGLSLVLFGVVTSYAFIAIGVLLILGALAGWIGDLLHAGTE
jgi:hypothetical protein